MLNHINPLQFPLPPISPLPDLPGHPGHHTSQPKPVGPLNKTDWIVTSWIFCPQKTGG